MQRLIVEESVRDDGCVKEKLLAMRIEDEDEDREDREAGPRSARGKGGRSA